MRKCIIKWTTRCQLQAYVCVCVCAGLHLWSLIIQLEAFDWASWWIHWGAVWLQYSKILCPLKGYSLPTEVIGYFSLSSNRMWWAFLSFQLIILLLQVEVLSYSWREIKVSGLQDLHTHPPQMLQFSVHSIYIFTVFFFKYRIFSHNLLNMCIFVCTSRL